MKERYLIDSNTSIKGALLALDGHTHDGQTLFVVDPESKKMVGTLTDGDIRRGLISGYSLEDTVSLIMHREFKFIHKDNFDVGQLKSYRERGVLFLPVLDEKGCVVDVCNLLKYKSLLPVDAVLMAGGKGERLRPLTERTPKPLLKVGDKAIIDHNVDRLISYGIKDISVTVNYLGDQIIDHYAQERTGVRIRCYEEPEFLGTIGAVRYVREFQHDIVLVMNSDVFTNIDYEDFFLHFLEHEADMSVAAVPYTVSVPYGIFDLKGRLITGIVEKPTFNYYANAGIYLIKRPLLDEIPKNTCFNATDLIEKLIAEGKRVVRFPLNGTWIDIGNPQEYQKANELVRRMMRD